MSNPPTIVSNRRLTVKELAQALGVGIHFVYQMRACGFQMEWDAEARGQTVTESEARSWIAQNCFKIVRGRGVVIKRS